MANQPKKYQKFVATAATATLVATAVVPAASADAKFSDIVKYDQAVQDEVAFLADLGVITGFEDGTFKPAQNITRGQAVKMLGRFLVENGYAEVPANWETEQAFSDVALDRTDRDLVKYAAVVKEAGVFQGSEGNVLNPAGFTTRENMALILDRLVESVTGKSAVEIAAAAGLTGNVSDLANAKEEAREAISALNALGVSNANEFKPKTNTQRVHFASFLARMIELAEEVVTKVESVTVIDANTIEVTFKTGEETETVQFTLEEALTLGENEVTFTHNGVEYTVTVNYTNEAPTEGTVAAVTAINASEIKVDFSKAVDADALEKAFEDAGNAAAFKLIDIDVNAAKDVAIADIQVSEDGKSAIILLAAPLKDGDKYAAQTNDQILATDGTKFEEYASATATFNAEAAPKFVAAEVTTDGSLLVTFDRPVQAGKLAGLKIDGVQIADANLVALGTNEAGDYTYEVAQNLANTFKTTGTHEVVAYYVTSTGGTTAPVLFGSYTVTVDVVTPAVTAITAKGANTFFLSTNTAVDLSKAALTVKKGNITFAVEKNAAGTQVFDNAVTVAENLTIVSANAGVDEKGKPGIWVVVSDAPKDANGLYQGQETSATIGVELTNYTAAGLIGTKYEGSVTLAKDDNKPKVKSTDLNKDTGVATIDFGKELEGAAADFVLRDKDGVIVTGKATTVSGSTITIAGLDKDKAPYSVELDKGQFNYKVQNTTGTALEDYTATAAKNDALTVSVGVAESVDPVAPYYAYTLNTVAAPGTITINYGTDMGTSALDAANYTLDGKALPAGTKVDFVNDKKTVRITLPAESYATTAEQLLIINTNVSTALGSNVVDNLVNKGAVNGLVAVTDNITPKLQSGLYQVTTQTVDATTETNKIELTFSENVTTNGTTDDLSVVVNGATIAVTGVAQGEKANQLVVTLGQNINVSQTATVTVKPESNTVTTDIKDAAGNKAQANTVATVTNYEYVSGTVTP